MGGWGCRGPHGWAPCMAYSRISCNNKPCRFVRALSSLVPRVGPARTPPLRRGGARCPATVSEGMAGDGADGASEAFETLEALEATAEGAGGGARFRGAGRASRRKRAKRYRAHTSNAANPSVSAGAQANGRPGAAGAPKFKFYRHHFPTFFRGAQHVGIWQRRNEEFWRRQGRPET